MNDRCYYILKLAKQKIEDGEFKHEKEAAIFDITKGCEFVLERIAEVEQNVNFFIEAEE